jgi:clostripain
MMRDDGMRMAGPWAVLIALAFIVPGQSVLASAPAPHQKEWTILVYEDGDNNLEGAGVHDLNEMETVGSNDDINVIVQFDRSPGNDNTNGNWSGAKRYYVTKDSDFNTISSTELSDLGDTNMGDPRTFINFTTWAVDHYPAKRYLVVFWDHGGGWHGVCWDDTSADYLNLDNISAALQGLKAHLGRNIDVVGFDACLMSGIEILYQIRDTCDVAAVSGTTEPDDGWPYDWILPALAMKPYMTDEELATEITNDYVNSYTDGKPDPQDTPTSTMSAWNMSKVEGLFEQFDQMSMRLAMNALTYNAYLHEARAATESYDPQHVVFLDVSNYPLYDIYDFCQNFLKPLGGPFAGLIIDPSIRQNMLAVQSLILGARIAERHGQRYPDGWGLTVYFPSGGNYPVSGTPRTEYDARYDNIDFSRDLYWDDFLKAYYAVKNVPDTPPYVAVASPAEDRSLNADDRTTMVTGTAFDTASVSLVEVRIDNGSWNKARGTVNWEYEWNIAGLSGRHTVTARSSDGFSTSPEVSRTVEIKPSSSGRIGTDSAIVIGGAAVILAAVGAVLLVRRKDVARLLHRGQKATDKKPQGE